MPISQMMYGLEMQDIANKMGKKLSEGLNTHSDINLAFPTEANEVFATFPRNKI